jgi:RNA polymerase sporulation-specific sigma factor
LLYYLNLIGGSRVSVNIKVNLSELYGKMEDESLVELVHNGDRESLNFLIKKYQKLVRAKARSYFLIGADKEDIIQEGMIGLFKAIRDFRREKMTAFRSFAEHCIYKQIVTAIKTASRKKHSPLNSYVSLDKPMYNDESTVTLLDVMPEEKITNPEALIIKKESINDIELKIQESLSCFEQKVLALYIDGQSYLEISEKLNTSIKSIDNALQRAKRKLSGDIPKLELLKEKKAIHIRMFHHQ